MLRQDKGYDHAVKAERFGEDKNEDHADEKTLLLSYGAHPCVSHDPDCHACCQTAVGVAGGFEGWGKEKEKTQEKEEGSTETLGEEVYIVLRMDERRTFSGRRLRSDQRGVRHEHGPASQPHKTWSWWRGFRSCQATERGGGGSPHKNEIALDTIMFPGTYVLSRLQKRQRSPVLRPRARSNCQRRAYSGTTNCC